MIGKLMCALGLHKTWDHEEPFTPLTCARYGCDGTWLG